MTTVRHGGVQIWTGDPMKSPWWWAQVTAVWSRIQSIIEASGYDKDRMVCPKNYWLDAKEADKWFKGREAARNSGVLN